VFSSNSDHSDSEFQGQGNAQPRQSQDNDAETPNSKPSTPMLDEDAVRAAAIEESRRKIAELERDRPLWEKAAQQRAQSQVAEEWDKMQRRQEEERLAREEAAREQERQMKARAENERRREEQAARKKKEAEERARAKREQEKAEKEMQEKMEQQRRREKERRRWASGPWTHQRALERYKVLAEAFDAGKWALPEAPLSFDQIPWPVLHSPLNLTVRILFLPFL
jgi:hypothetical protein